MTVLRNFRLNLNSGLKMSLLLTIIPQKRFSEVVATFSTSIYKFYIYIYKYILFQVYISACTASLYYIVYNI